MPSLNIKGRSVSYEDDARDAVVNYLYYSEEAESKFDEADVKGSSTFYYGSTKYKISLSGTDIYTVSRA